jgi:hypothetical protein
LNVRCAAVIALAIIASVAVGCGSSSANEQPSTESARPFANDFTRRLVVDGRWTAIERDVSPLLRRRLRDFQATIRLNGMRRVSPNGALRHDCPTNQSLGAGKDCFVYVTAGEQVIPAGGSKTLNARFRLWVSHDSGAWQAVSYDYDLLHAN